MVDTAAALTFCRTCESLSHTVASVHSPKDYSPITLSGIVQQGRSSVTTDLTVGFHFHLPYLTREGTPANLVMATGPNVMVNAILGLPFITQTKMVIDTADQVAEMRAFDTPPFPIDFRRAMCAILVINEAAASANAALHADVVADFKAIKAHVYKKSAFLSRKKEPGDIPGSILMSPKQARVVDVCDNSTVDGVASVATIGSVFNPFLATSSWIRTCLHSTMRTQRECALALSLDIFVRHFIGSDYEPRDSSAIHLQFYA